MEEQAKVLTINIAQDVARKLKIYALLKGDSVTNIATELLDKGLENKRPEMKELLEKIDF